MQMNDGRLVYEFGDYIPTHPGYFEGADAVEDFLFRCAANRVVPLGTAEMLQCMKESDFNTLHEWVMLCKCYVAGDEDAFYDVLDQDTINDVSAAMNKLKPSDARMWGRAIIPAVTSGLIAKLKEDPSYGISLMHTGDREIIYRKDRQTFWGVSNTAHQLLNKPNAKLLGNNYLGRSLEIVRGNLRTHPRYEALMAAVTEASNRPQRR